MKYGRWVAVTGMIAIAAPAALANPMQNHPDTEQKLCPIHPPVVGDPDVWIQNPVPMIMAGDQTGSPPDSPTNRVDANISSSPFAGVAHLTLGGAAACTGTPISRFHIVSAGHCVDFDDNGTNDIGTNVVIRFNYSGSGSTIIGSGSIASVDVHPDYTGFSNPTVNDDLIIITLNEPLPNFIPIYPVFTGLQTQGQVITMVGYGRTGFGDVGDTIGGNSSIKRVGQNTVELLFDNDDPGGAMVKEIFEYDFDGPTNGTNCFGGPGTLGNDIESSVGSGDSGGPSFVQVGDELRLWGVNTFGVACIAPPPLFGSIGGGMLVTGYLDWISGFIPPSPFDMIEPADETAGVDVAPLLDWERADFASSYTVRIATDANMFNVVYEETVSGVANHQWQMPVGELGGDTEYYWVAIANNSNGSTDADDGPYMFVTVANGDLNGDGVINGTDLAILLSVWGSNGSGTGADLNGDGIVNGADLATMLASWTTA